MLQSSHICPIKKGLIHMGFCELLHRDISKKGNQQSKIQQFAVSGNRKQQPVLTLERLETRCKEK